MAVIAPAVLAESVEGFAHDLSVAASVSNRVQIDLADGEFAPNRTVGIEQIYCPDGVDIDLHVMFDNPSAHLETMIAVKPSLVIVHYEAKHLHNTKAIEDIRKQLQSAGIKFGLAILPNTSVDDVSAHLGSLDHVLVFTGELGHYGGKMQTDCLSKISRLKAINPSLEVGVDGGIDEANIAGVVRAGADVLNVGSFIQKASRPQEAYDTLKLAIAQQT